MASIIANSKGGKIVSYKFKSCVGRDDCGKQVFRCRTWKVPGGLAPSKAIKAAEKAAAAWEQEAKAEYEKDLQDARRAREREIAKCKTDFVHFVKNVWFPICIEDGEHKPKTISFYNDTTKNITAYFEGSNVQKNTAAEIHHLPADRKRLFAPERPSPLPHFEYDFRLCGAAGGAAEKSDGESRPTKIGAQ